jgi:predicted 3-demethylubiquinone-9 3-methyltransferase (glyoxalase superfamily)
MEAPGAEQMEGKVITGIFELAGQRCMALDGGPVFNFTEAISFYVECADQKEVDYFWNKLSAVSEAEQCGWCKDKFGMSWQIVPKQLGELMGSPDPAKSMRVVNAMLKMKKIIVADLQKAHDEA